MTEHVSTSRMKRFCVRALPLSELTAIAEHLAGCPTCHQQFTETLRSRRGSAPLRFTLAPEFWFRHEHVDYEQLVGLTDKTLDATEREIIDMHLKVCASCKEDIRSFLAFRKQMAPEMEVFATPASQQPLHERPSAFAWWRTLAWKPAYVTAIVILGIVLTLAIVFLKRRTNNLEAKQSPTPNLNLGAASQTPTPDNRAANSPSPPATPNESPVEKPNSASTIVVLNDLGGTITVDKRGNISGLDDVPVPTREEIAKVLLSEKLEQPPILKELGGQEGSLRGSKNTPPFRLTYPSRTVIVTDRPTLKWEQASGASSYRVYINDPAGHGVARSEELPSQPTEWILPQPLKRGEIYVWTVMAVVDGKEIVSPGRSSPEMKFQVLSSSSLREWNLLKKSRSHLALGVFYTRKGMIAEAEREFRILVRENPSSQLAKKLLSQVQSWTRR